MMKASLPQTLLIRVLPVLALLLSMGLFGATCSTGNPGTVFSPPGNNGDNGGGGGGNTAPGPSAAPMAGSLLQAGAPSLAAIAPADLAKDIDIHASIVLWFSESLRADTVTAASLILRPKANPEFPVATQNTWLAANRCLILLPATNLSPLTEYEIVATEDITDLEGERLQLPKNGRLAKFTTSSALSGQAPEVLGSFPPAASIDVPNDTPVVLVFSKPMDFTGITDAVTLKNLSTQTAADYDRAVALSHRFAGNRVFEFPHLSDDQDLNAELQVRVASTVTDAEFVPLALAKAYLAKWNTLAFARPSSIDFDAAAFGNFAPAVNLSNQNNFPVQVTLPLSVSGTDSVTLLVHENVDSVFVQQSLLAGGGLLNFNLDLTQGQNSSVFQPSTNLIVGGYVERQGKRSSVQVYRDTQGLEAVVPHDLVRPLLFTYGPPVGQFGSQFVTDLPRFRPYGRASEAIAAVGASFPPSVLSKSRSVPEPPASNFFVGPFFDPGQVSEGPLAFDVTLTDVAGNPASAPSPGSVSFRGFVGSSALAPGGGDVRVIAFDRDALFLLGGATVHIEDSAGGNEDVGTTGSDGSFTFGQRVGPQTITLELPGYDSVSVVGFAVSEISVPMPSALQTVASMSPQVTGLTSGVLTVASNLFVDSIGNLDADGQQTYDLNSLFGTLNTRLQRLGWYAAFHDVVAFPAPDRYFRFYGVDGRILIEPGTAGNLIPPVLPMVESTNQLAGAVDYIYPLQVTPGLGYGPLVQSNTMVGTVIPGVPGFIGLGAGAVNLPGGGGVNGDAELELALHGLAVTEGADAANVTLQVFVEDGAGNQGLVRVAAPLAQNPASVALPLPDVPTDGVWGSTAAYPFTHSFTHTLLAAGGVFHLTVEDSAATPQRWHFWIAASMSAADPFVLNLPSLRNTPSSGIGTPPLEMVPGGAWTAFVEAFAMPAGFSEVGFFFSELERDAQSWARSAVGAALNF